MKKVNEALKTMGVFTVTGFMAMMGFVGGVLLFVPERFHVIKNKPEEKESE